MNPNPDDVYGPPIAELFRKLCEMVANESGATTVRVTAEFVYKGKKGSLLMKTFTTPDATVERMLDPKIPMPRGSKLQHEATEQLRSAMEFIARSLGGK
jgi:hypothetical protein